MKRCAVQRWQGPVQARLHTRDAEIASFVDICPPFRAACYGMGGAWFDVSLAEKVFKELAGRNDQMVAIYLPYCDRL